MSAKLVRYHFGLIKAPFSWTIENLEAVSTGSQSSDSLLTRSDVSENTQLLKWAGQNSIVRKRRAMSIPLTVASQ